MKSRSALLLVAAAVVPSVSANGTWNDWGSSSAAPAAAGWTDWVTTTEYEQTTTTTTVYVTQPPVTVTLPAVTVTVTYTPPPNTVVNTVVNTATIVSVNTATEQVSVTNVVTDFVTNVVTSLSVVTQISSVSYCPPTLSGLVTCPSRIINPTYTTSTPLPTSYLWGCAPGFLCKPPRIDCNFESNTPADSYYCSPDECEPVQPRPPNDFYLGLENVNDTCAWLTPVDDYFNINPGYFGLDFSIFNIYGQPTCTPPPPTVTTTVIEPTTVLAPTTVVEPVTVTVVSEENVPTTVVVNSVQVVPTTVVVPSEVVSVSTVDIPYTVTVSSWEVWTTTEAEYVTVYTSSGWNSWHTKRAELEKRDPVQIVAGPACYAVCNNACGVFQSVGLVKELCDPKGVFEAAMSNVYACTSRHSANFGGATSAVPGLYKPLSFCNQLKKRALETQQALDLAASPATATAEVRPSTFTSMPSPPSSPVSGQVAPSSSPEAFCPRWIPGCRK